MAKSINSIKVIVVDDIPLVIDGVELALSEQDDIELIGSARNSREAISLISSLQRDIDIAIVDLNLKEKHNIKPFQLCQDILQRFSKIKVLAFTIHDGEKLIYNLKKIGVKGYLPKKYEQTELLNAIRTIAGGEEYFPSTADVASEMDTNEEELEPDLMERFLRLTPRELEVVHLMIEGFNIDKIAQKLGISPNTVNSHRHSIFSKLAVKSAHELTALLKGKI